MDLSTYTLRELLFIFLNVKGIKNNKVMKTDDAVPDFFQFDSRIVLTEKDAYKTNPYTSDRRQENIDALNKYYPNINFESKSNFGIVAFFDNENHHTLRQLLQATYDVIAKKLLTVSTVDFSKDFAIAAFGFRASMDLTANLYTTDLHSSRMSSKESLELFIKLLFQTNLNEQLNLNFRELQPDQVDERANRDTQFRINLRYFFDKYYAELKLVNPFRAEQMDLNKQVILLKNYKKPNDKFIDRIRFYQNEIVEENVDNKLDVEQLRRRLKLSKIDDAEDDEVKHRDNRAKELARGTQPDLCASCQNIYRSEDRTFKIRDTDMWYFELHHVIPFANKDIQTEVADNYVKLCAVCHRALTPNRADEDFQKDIIANIFENRPEALTYVRNVQDTIHDKKAPVDFVYGILK